MPNTHTGVPTKFCGIEATLLRAKKNIVKYNYFIVEHPSKRFSLSTASSATYSKTEESNDAVALQLGYFLLVGISQVVRK